MTTLANLRAKLNAELGVASDTETAPWTQARRSTAVSEGYAELWRAGVWRPVRQDLASASSARTYALTSIRKLNRIELLDSSDNLLEYPKGVVEPDGAGSYQLLLRSPVADGYTLRVYGWTAYTSTFASDAAEDDLPAEYNRIPLLKAKAILLRDQLGRMARYKTTQATPPALNVTVDQLLGMIAAAEREFEAESRVLAGQRPRVGQMRRL